MANQLSALLEQWYPSRDSCDWVLGTVYKTEGPCYRKAGAMMLFNSLGQQFGMLSGGCLESDIQTHARKVMQTGQPLSLCYDGSDEDDLAYHLGIGCGGTVYIMLHSVDAANNYQDLETLRSALMQRQTVRYCQQIPKHFSETAVQSICKLNTVDGGYEDAIKTVENCFEALIKPDPHLLIAGGGIDAQPLVAMAKQLGWTVTVWDPRPANARREFFMAADYLLNQQAHELSSFVEVEGVDMAVVMTHNVELDADALSALNGSGIHFMALLGPINRKDKVLKQAGLSEDQLVQPLSGPAGFDIGGELPESIALSILSECHQRHFLSQRQQRNLPSLSQEQAA